MDQLVPLLERLAAKLGTTTEYLWSVLVAQARIEAIMGFAWSVGLFAVAYFSRRHFVAWRASTNADAIDTGIASGAFWCAFVCMLIAASLNLHTAIVAIGNPEYWALKEIFDALK